MSNNKIYPKTLKEYFIENNINQYTSKTVPNHITLPTTNTEVMKKNENPDEK